MAVTVDVHKHGPPDKERIFMDSCVWSLGHAGQAENSLPELFVKCFGGFAAIALPVVGFDHFYLHELH